MKTFYKRPSENRLFSTELSLGRKNAIFGHFYNMLNVRTLHFQHFSDVAYKL